MYQLGVWGKIVKHGPHVQVPKAYGRFDFDHVEPAGVLGSVVELQPSGNAPGYQAPSAGQHQVRPERVDTRSCARNRNDHWQTVAWLLEELLLRSGDAK